MIRRRENTFFGMKLLLKLKDMCYYEYLGNIVWIINKLPYRERPLKTRLQSLRDRGEI